MYLWRNPQWVAKEAFTKYNRFVSFHVVFMATPVFSVPVLRSLLEGEYRVTVYTAPDKSAGRGKKKKYSPIKEAALENNLQVYQPISFNDLKCQRELAALKPDIIVVAAYGKRLPAAVLRTPPNGCINIHPSLLPEYRGASPVVTAILDGKSVTGVSIMAMDEGMDTGPILFQKEYKIGSKETAAELSEKLFVAGGSILLDVIPKWMSGELLPIAQDERKATSTGKVTKFQGEANWELAASLLERRVRAFYPWPSLHSSWKGRLIKILEAQVADVFIKGVPGEVVYLDTGVAPVGVLTGKGVLLLKTIQIEGKSPMSAKAFLSGHSQFIGSSLPS